MAVLAMPMTRPKSTEESQEQIQPDQEVSVDGCIQSYKGFLNETLQHWLSKRSIYSANKDWHNACLEQAIKGTIEKEIEAWRSQSGQPANSWCKWCKAGHLFRINN